MIVACTGDLHRDGRRRATCERVLYAISDDAAKRGSDLLVIPGDFYDTHPTEEGVLLARRWLTHTSDRMPVFIASGNHDPDHSVTVLDAFRGEHPIVVRETPDALTLSTRAGALHVAALPDLRGAYLNARAKKRGVVTTAKDEALDVLDRLGDYLDKIRVPGEPTLFAGHLTLGCAKMDNDQPARAPELAFSLAELGRVRAHAYVLGHIHLRQGGELHGAPWFYTGSPYGTDFGDLSPKSYTLLHWDGVRFNAEIVPTPAPRLVLLVGTWCRFGDLSEMSLSYGPEHATDAPVVAADMHGADVRLRYDVPLDDRAAAERAAADHHASILAAGAIGCLVDPIPPKVTRTRAPLVQGAKTDAEKLDAFWLATNTAPDASRKERVLTMLARWQADLPPPPPVSQVRVDALRWRAMGKLVPPGSLTPAPGVQVITGPNRAGKTTLLACLMGALWCEGGKGDVDRLARGKDALLEVDLTVKDGAVTIAQNVWAKTVTFTGPGGDAYKGGRKGYYERAEKLIPSREVLEQIVILPQRGNGLLDLVDGPLKTALLRLAGSSRFGDYADRGRRALNDLSAEVKAKRDALAKLGDPAARVTEAEAERDTATARAAKLRQSRETAGKLFAALAALAEAERALTSVQERERTVSDAARAALARTDSVDYAALRTELQTARDAAATARARREALRISSDRAASDLADLADQIRRSDGRLATERARIERLRARLAGLPAAEAARDAIPAAREALATADADMAEVTANVERVEHRGALVAIRENATGHWTMSEEALRYVLAGIYDIADTSLGADLRSERKRLQRVISERGEAAQHLADLEKHAAQLPDLKAAAADLAVAEAAAAEEEEYQLLLTWREGALEQHVATIHMESTAVDEEEALCRVREQRLTVALQGEAEHARTAGTLASLSEQADALAVERTDAYRKLTAAQGEVALADLDREWAGRRPTERTLQHLDEEAHRATRDAARAEERLCARREALQAWHDARAELDALESDLGDATAFLRSVDKNGLQAYEADAIGTEIADSATELLQAHGFRWLLSYEGQRDRGEGTVEQARWAITDLDTGTSYDARAKGGGSSGGEEVVVATAIFLAAGAAVKRRGGGVPDATLMIDEMTSAVREPLVVPWLNMLRDGAARSGVRTILLVPPNDQRLIAACDGTIKVRPTDLGSVVE